MKNRIRYMGGIICGSSSIDQGTQNLSAFNFIDQVTADIKSTDPIKTTKSLEKITIPFSFQVISLWKRSNVSDFGTEIKGTAIIEEIDPQGKILQTIPVEFLIPVTAIRARHILKVQGMMVSTTGEYCFQFREVDEKGERSEPIAKLCFDVVLNKS